MKHFANLALLFTALLALLSTAGSAPAKPGPGTVVGRAVTAAGKPIAGAKIWVKPVVTTGLYETRTDANGYYVASGLPPVGYRVYGWHEVEYRGERFCLRLGHKDPADYSPLNPAKGATRDLVWRTQGRIEDVELYSDMGYFGGSVAVMNELSVPARNAPLEFTLTPAGPLIDGSAGKTLTRKPNAEGYLLDVPVGVYKVTATVTENGSKKPVRLGSSQGSLGAQATLEFKPLGQTCAGSSASGVGRAYLYWAKGGAAGAPASGGTVPTNPAGRTGRADGMAGVWEGTLTLESGQSFLVRYDFTDLEYGEGYVALGGDFYECASAGDCARIGRVTAGKRVPTAGANFTTTLEESGASFDTVGHFEGGDFVGITDAVFQGQEAVVRLRRR